MGKFIKDIDVKDKKVLLRLDLNVPLNSKGEITDKTRLLESMATINYLCDHGAKVIICSHLGRPKGKVDLSYSLRPVADAMAKLSKYKVTFATDTIGDDAKAKVDALQSQEILILENLRFDDREEANDEEFARSLASMADIFCLDAFGTSHRKHASTYGVTQFLPSYIGLLIQKELKSADSVLVNPARPLVAVLGGSKVQDKLPVIENLIDKADTILLGGGMAFTFLKAMGGNVGKSIVDEEQLPLAEKLMSVSKEKGVEIVLPVDCVCNESIDSEAKPKVCDSMAIDDGLMGLDIGKKTIKLFKKYIKSAKSIVWNGPMGVFENAKYSTGTKKVAKYLGRSKAFTFVGGGDSVSAVINLGCSKHINHLSTGGGASLKLLGGEPLVCIKNIEEKNDD